MNDQRIVFFDLETGGLDSARHPIIQCAWIAVDPTWREIARLAMKINFDPMTAEPEALRVNGWDAESWKTEALDSHAALLIVSAFLREHATMEKISQKGRSYTVARLAAHNAPFDCGFLVQWFKAANLFCPAACYEPLDTLSLARWASFVAPTQPKDHKLGSLCEWLGIEHQEAHDALGDVRATVQVARVLAERFGLGWRTT